MAQPHKAKLTEAYVRDLPPPASGEQTVWDSTQPGFGLRVRPGGSKAFVVKYRTRSGRQGKETLGRWPALSVDRARTEARRLLGRVADGADPAAERRSARLAAATPASTVGDVTARFITEYARPKNRSWRETDRILSRYVLPVIGDRPIETVGATDLHRLIRDVARGGAPIMANRVLAAVRRLFGWAVDELILPASPAAGLRAPAAEVRRDRTLSEAELAAVWQAANQTGWPFGPLIQLLILTAQRRDEVGGMRWEEVDLDRHIWTIPRERAKNDSAHLVHLAEPAATLLASLPRTSPFVFSTTGASPVSGFSRAKQRLDMASGVSDWTLHDLRRTATTGMAALGVPPHVADKILNHKTGTIGGVAAIYNRHAYLDERRAALDTWAARVLEIAGQKPADVGDTMAGAPDG